MAGDKNKANVTVVNRLCEFLVVATHAVLYIQQVYPQRMFEMRHKYGVATFYSKHPDVNDYIARTVANMRGMLEEDAVECVAIVIYDGEAVHSRYVFDVTVGDGEATAQGLGELDVQFRGHLCRLLSNGAPDAERERARETVREGRRFEYVLRTKGVRTDDKWMAADGRERGEFRREFEVVPVKDADRFSAVLQMASRVETESEEAA